uniref:uncharacterized protein n=1 Tax=Myxine glutinosa TaxID=7769 RepID=UPI00358FF70C
MTMLVQQVTLVECWVLVAAALYSTGSQCSWPNTMNELRKSMTVIGLDGRSLMVIRYKRPLRNSDIERKWWIPDHTECQEHAGSTPLDPLRLQEQCEAGGSCSLWLKTVRVSDAGVMELLINGTCTNIRIIVTPDCNASHRLVAEPPGPPWINDSVTLHCTAPWKLRQRQEGRHKRRGAGKRRVGVRVVRKTKEGGGINNTFQWTCNGKTVSNGSTVTVIGDGRSVRISPIEEDLQGLWYCSRMGGRKIGYCLTRTESDTSLNWSCPRADTTKPQPIHLVASFSIYLIVPIGVFFLCIAFVFFKWRRLKNSASVDITPNFHIRRWQLQQPGSVSDSGVSLCSNDHTDEDGIFDSHEALHEEDQVLHKINPLYISGSDEDIIIQESEYSAYQDNPLYEPLA